MKRFPGTFGCVTCPQVQEESSILSLPDDLLSALAEMEVPVATFAVDH